VAFGPSPAPQNRRPIAPFVAILLSSVRARPSATKKDYK
jgi:hypothetical protein